MKKNKVIISTILAVILCLNCTFCFDNNIKPQEVKADTQVNLADRSYDLSFGDYLITTTGYAMVTELGENGTKLPGNIVYSGHKLNKEGRYIIEKYENKITYVQNIELYNGDGKNKANKLLGNKIAIGGFDGPYSNAWSTGKVENGLDQLPVDSKGYLNYVTDDIFKLISETGINLITWCNANYSEAQQAKNAVTKGLELADKYGLGMYVRDSVYLKDSANNGTFSEKNLESRIKNYSRYPSFLGINLVDEPSSLDFAANQKTEEYYISNFKETSKVISSYSNLTSYMNLFPYELRLANTSDTESDYTKYLREALDINVDVLSFDRYPFTEKTTKYTDATGTNSTMINYFDNLRIVRDLSEEYNKPFWTYIQAGCDLRDGGDKSSIADNKKDTPNEAEIFWNINTCLAYGAKGIQYFPLIQPFYYAYDGEDYDFERTGLIGADGKTKTQWYEYAKKANKQINAISDVLVNSTPKAIVVNEIPEKMINFQQVGNLPSSYITDSAKNYKSLKSVTVNPDKVNTKICLPKYYGALVGCFDYNGKEVYYVVNYNTKDNNEVTLNFDNTYEIRTTREANKAVTSAKSLTLNMKPGEGILIELDYQNNENGEGDVDETTTKKPSEVGNTTTKPAVTTAKPTTVKPTVKPTAVKKPSKTNVKKASKKLKEKKIKLTLKKVKDASKYNIQVSTKKSFKKVLASTTVKNVSLSFNNKKFSNKKTLYIRARAVKKVKNKNYYSDWCKAKKVTVKK